MYLAISPDSKLYEFLKNQKSGDGQSMRDLAMSWRMQARTETVSSARREKGINFGRRHVAAGNRKDAAPQLFFTPGSRFGCSKSLRKERENDEEQFL